MYLCMYIEQERVYVYVYIYNKRGCMYVCIYVCI
jgi:hypothetical protein